MASKYAKRLDRSRDFGTYHPAWEGAHYNQDGFDFDHEGHIHEGHLTPELRKRLEKKPPPPPPEKKDGNGEGAETAPNPQQNGEGQQDGEEPNSLNLEMWLRGEEDYPFPDVQKAVRARFNVWKTAKRDLLMFLVEEQRVVPVEELSDEYKALVA